jgi:hypothetical protein
MSEHRRRPERDHQRRRGDRGQSSVSSLHRSLL